MHNECVACGDDLNVGGSDPTAATGSAPIAPVHGAQGIVTHPDCARFVTANRKFLFIVPAKASLFEGGAPEGRRELTSL